MPREYDYHCTKCGLRPGRNNDESKELLTAVVVVFKNIGYAGRTLRSRVVDWLCAACLAKNQIWNTGDRGFIDKVAKDKVDERPQG